jgi:putative lipoprotein (rSAM/lipoprotein system)
MQNYLSKLLVLVIGFVLGLSKEVAAQYGIVNCQYLFKGKVESGLCAKGIEGIRVSVADPADTNFSPEPAMTDADGSFQVLILTPTMPFYMETLELRVDDIDGEANGGKFLSQKAIVKLDESNVFETRHAEWSREYSVLTENKFLLKKEDGLPCSDK